MYQVIYKSGETVKEIFLKSTDDIYFIFGITKCEFNNFYYNINPVLSESIINKINKIPTEEAPRKKIEVVFV
tara:strand:- start:29 stop:244 length:216 start_codon:yes stop_codon:yes gene_type:complete